jgi:2-hydroxymuconate-semialdehyde hydrolase
MSLVPEVKRTKVLGGELAYLDLGEGPAVLLLHGFPTSSYLWRREAWLLAQRMRVIAPDLLGYGESDKAGDADLSEPAQVGYMLEFLDRLGIRELAVVGHDLGGAIAQMLALDGGVEVEALILLDTACFDAWPTEPAQRLRAVPPDRRTAVVAERAVRQTFAEGVAHHERLADDAVHSYVRPWLANPAALFRAAGAVTGKGLAGREADLADLDMPTLVIWGEEDPYLSADLAERLGEAILGSAVALLPGCSHFVTEDAPQTVGPLIYEYLRSRYLRETHAHAEPGRVLLQPPTRGGPT